MIDQELRIDAEHLIEQVFLCLRDLSHGGDPRPGEAVRYPSSDPPEICQRLMIPQGPPVSLLIQDPDVVLHVLRGNVQRHLGKIQVGADPRRGSDSRRPQDIVHDLYAQLLRGHLIHPQILCHIHEHLVDTVDMDIFLRNVLQIDSIDLRRIVDIELHPRRRHDIIDSRRDLEHSAPAGNSQRFHGRRHGKADRLLRALRIRDHEIRGQRVKPPLSALHRGVKRFQVNTYIGFSTHQPQLPVKDSFLVPVIYRFYSLPAEYARTFVRFYFCIFDIHKQANGYYKC